MVLLTIRPTPLRIISYDTPYAWRAFILSITILTGWALTQSSTPCTQDFFKSKPRRIRTQISTPLPSQTEALESSTDFNH